jgi:hypothetical protein
MFEFKEPIDVIMWMVFVAAGLAVVFTVFDMISDNIRFRKKQKKS